MILKLIIFGVVCFMVGATFGIFIMALVAANRRDDDEEFRNDNQRNH